MLSINFETLIFCLVSACFNISVLLCCSICSIFNKYDFLKNRKKIGVYILTFSIIGSLIASVIFYIMHIIFSNVLAFKLLDKSSTNTRDMLIYGSLIYIDAYLTFIFYNRKCLKLPKK